MAAGASSGTATTGPSFDYVAFKIIGGEKDARTRSDLAIGALGSGSDFTPFLQHAGVPTLNIGFGGEDGGGIYHSIYDDFYWYTHFSDTAFVYGRALAQTAGTIRYENTSRTPPICTKLVTTRPNSA